MHPLDIEASMMVYNGDTHREQEYSAAFEEMKVGDRRFIGGAMLYMQPFSARGERQ